MPQKPQKIGIGKNNRRRIYMFTKKISDLADESFGLDLAKGEAFSDVKEYISHGFGVRQAGLLGYSYHTLSGGQFWTSDTAERQALCRLIAKIITAYCEAAPVTSVLTVGLGSSSVTADSLGPRTAERILVTDSVMHERGIAKMCAVVPGVSARTGIDTAAAVRAIAEQVKAELIITVDSLSAISSDRLCKVVQITNHGVIPGSAMSHSSGEISEKTMPCPVISVGVPTVIRADLLSGNEKDRSLLVSSVDTDIAVDCYASIIGGAINLFHIGNTAG